VIKRRVEIVAFERERVIRKPASMTCPVCQRNSAFLTARQAGAVAQVTSQSIYRWLATGNAHGVRTAGGGLRICQASLFRSIKPEVEPDRILTAQNQASATSMSNVYLIS